MSRTKFIKFWKNVLKVPAMLPLKTLSAGPSYLQKLFRPGRDTSKNFPRLSLQVIHHIRGQSVPPYCTNPMTLGQYTVDHCGVVRTFIVKRCVLYAEVCVESGACSRPMLCTRVVSYRLAGVHWLNVWYKIIVASYFALLSLQWTCHWYVRPSISQC